MAEARTLTSKIERYKELQMQSPEIELPECTSLEEGYRNLKRTTIDHWGLARVKDGVLIPLLDIKGKLIAFSIRRDDSNPKYTFSKGTKKGIPFGLWENKSEIIKQGFAYIVEGQFDAIALWQRGYKNVVAIMGSAITEQQAMLLLSVTSTLMLVMDGDDAGRTAAAKIKKQWSKAFDVGIFSLPDGVDPDEYEGSFDI